jgi:alanine or glycine:cation symporter, AGCS family
VEGLGNWLQGVESIVWGPAMVFLLLGTGLLLTIRTRAVQVRRMGESLRQLRGRFSGTEKAAGDISPLQALATALGGKVGMGNIAGVATAISLGGPGALFWMWMTALVGMATIYGEVALSMKYRITAADGSMSGGPMYYLSRGFSNKKLGKILALIFAGGAGLGALLAGVTIQSNAIADIFHRQFAVPLEISGIVLTLLTGLVVIGGIHRIGKVAARLVPFMIVLYLLGGLCILLLRIHEIPGLLWLIVESAFNPASLGGGLAGAGIITVMQVGVNRGLFSNEAGWGVDPIFHGAAQEVQPHRQATVAMNGVLIDTIIVCTMTGLVILLAGGWQGDATSATLTAQAFGQYLPLGEYLVAMCTLMFGISTMFVGCYQREKVIEYIVGTRYAKWYRYWYVAFVYVGAIFTVDQIWSMNMILVAFAVLPNLLGLIVLSGEIAESARQ